MAISHRNEDSDEHAVFNYTLQAEGLVKLQDRFQSSDHWRHRQFGMVLSGSASTTLLRRKNASALASSGAASSFELTASTAAAQTETSAQLHSLVAAQHDAVVGGAVGGESAAAAVAAREQAVATRVTAHASWWSDFRGRSHIAVSSTNASEASGTALLTQQYALWRYLQAIQTGTWVPIKFNGQLWTANLPPETRSSSPTFRQWE